MIRSVFRSTVATCVLALVVAVPAGAAAFTTFAHVAAPGYPADVAVAPNGTIWTASYVGQQVYGVPSTVQSFSPTGTPLAVFEVHGQDLGAQHGVSALAFDSKGRVYAGDQSIATPGRPGRVLRFDPQTGEQSTYARLPDLPRCGPKGGANCTTTAQDLPPAPDFAVFDKDGTLFVTDLQQALVWRIPRGGGTAVPWLRDSRLDGGTYGVAGIKLTPDGNALLLTTMTSGQNTALVPSLGSGGLWRVTLQKDGGHGDLRSLWRGEALDGPDGIAVGRSGNIYMTLDFSNQIATVTPSGKVTRSPSVSVPTPLFNPFGGSPIDNPSGIAFAGDRLVTANISSTLGLAEHWLLVATPAPEQGLALHMPRIERTHHERKHRKS